MYEEQIVEKLNEIISQKQNVDENTEEGYFNKISASLVSLEDHLREQMQAETSEKISTILNKLKSDGEITETDLMLIRLWMVGDASSYVEMENDYKQWLEELNRLFDVIQELKGQDLPGKGLIKEYYTRLSDIVRRYLENRFSFRAPEMTTEEFMENIKNSSVLVEEHKELLKEFLSHCDMVKFAKYGPTPIEMLDSFKSAESLVEQTRLEEEAKE